MDEPQDQVIAKQVHDAVAVLNTALNAAYDAGLYVDLDYASSQRIDRHRSQKFYHAKIERRKTIKEEFDSIATNSDSPKGTPT